MPINKTTQERIEREAYKRYGALTQGYHSYISGGIAEAERTQQLEEVLEKIIKMIQPHSPMQIREIKMLIKEALNQYRNNLSTYVPGNVSEVFRQLKESPLGEAWDKVKCVCAQLGRDKCELNCPEWGP